MFFVVCMSTGSRQKIEFQSSILGSYSLLLGTITVRTMQGSCALQGVLISHSNVGRYISRELVARLLWYQQCVSNESVTCQSSISKVSVVYLILKDFPFNWHAVDAIDYYSQWLQLIPEWSVTKSELFPCIGQNLGHLSLNISVESGLIC